MFWSVKFIQIDNLSRHPSQIYEAIFEGIILLFILNIFYKKFSQKTGMLSSLFVILYSMFRFFIEFTRAPDPHLGLIAFNFSLGQIVSILFMCAGLVLLYTRNDIKKK
jgi:phosphatidylglycerol:prolipoprotein diacylglycerol transferase